MTTIGYGDLLPISFYGKALAMVIAYYGVFMMSLFVAIATLQLKMTNGENQAFQKLMVSERACNLIII